MAKMTNLAHPNFAIYVLPFKGIEEWMTEFLSDFIPFKFGTPCIVLPAITVPEEFNMPVFQGYNSREIVEYVADKIPPDGKKIIGLVPVTLWDHQVQGYLLGRAQIGGQACVLNVTPLGRCDTCPSVIWRYSRYDLATLALHELGHTFGLYHCEESHCVMVRGQDNGPPLDYCLNCIFKIRTYLANTEYSQNKKTP